jgi:hypothetical protein
VPTLVEQLPFPDIELSPPLVLVNAGAKFAVNVLVGPVPKVQLPPAGTAAATVCASASLPDRPANEPTKTATPTSAARRDPTNRRAGSHPMQRSRCPGSIHNSPIRSLQRLLRRPRLRAGRAPGVSTVYRAADSEVAGSVG